MLRTALRALSVVVLAAGVFAWSAAQTLTIALPVEPASIDAHIPTDSPSAMVTSHIFDTLYRWDSVSGQIVPHLATSATMSDDGMSWTLVLRDDVVFHNGLPFNAEVVKGSMERLFDPATAAPFAWILGITESIDVVDEYTVRFNLSSPFAPFLSHLTHSGVAIVHPDVVAELGERHYEEPVGTGPFRVVNWDRGNQVVLERFDGYWGEAPGIEQLIFRTVPEDTTRVAMLESGEVDVARVPAQDVARVDANPNVTVSNVSGVRTIFIYFNHTKEPFTDVRVRQAMNHAINMDEIADFVHGGTARPSDAAIAPGIFGYCARRPLRRTTRNALASSWPRPATPTASTWCCTARPLATPATSRPPRRSRASSPRSASTPPSRRWSGPPTSRSLAGRSRRTRSRWRCWVGAP
jgi:ABC-type transport system substrate-binding protein